MAIHPLMRGECSDFALQHAAEGHRGRLQACTHSYRTSQARMLLSMDKEACRGSI